jgi:Ca2+-transporting ATPase
LDDDFSSIVSAVRMGRRIVDNLKNALAYVLAVHVPIAGMSLLPVVFRWPLALMPAHIAFLELIIDPACSVVFEAESEDKRIMRRKPRKIDEPLFKWDDMALSLAQGLVVLLIVANIYGLTLLSGAGEAKARTLAFTALVTANLGLILTNRSWTRTFIETLKTPNNAMKWVFAGTIICLGAVLYTPFLQGLFKFEALTATDILLAAGAGAVSILWFELLKYLNSRWHAKA